MIEYRVKKDGIIIEIFLNNSNQNLIFAPGLPQSIDKYHPLVKQAKEIGFNLFIPHYPGTHDSDGNLSVQGAVKALADTIKIIKTGSAVELYGKSIIKWDPTNISVLGFSFGALPALLQESAVDKTILLCPFVAAGFHLGSKKYLSENLIQTFDFLKEAYPKTYRFSPEDLIKELKTISLPRNKTNLVIISKKDDKSIPIQEIELLEKLYNCEVLKLPGGHGSFISDNYFKKILG